MKIFDEYWAKSPDRGQSSGELLTEHLRAARAAARRLRARVGDIEGIAPEFWDWVELACLLHDAGKLPDGFQRMVRETANHWGQRHEVYSLGFVTHLLVHLPEEHRDWIAIAVLTHHRPISGPGGRSLKHRLNTVYRTVEEFTEAIGPVDTVAAGALQTWLAAEAGIPPPPVASAQTLTGSAYEEFVRLVESWEIPEEQPERDLTAVLLQGAVTLADHIASAHQQILLCQPLDARYPTRFTERMAAKGTEPFAHQLAATTTDGHLLLRAPTGWGKTESALLWAARQVETLRERCGGVPRVFYTLPYLASINAMTERLGAELDDRDLDLIGVAHSRAAGFHLQRAADDDCDHGPTESDALGRHARRAVSRAAATKLFREPIRVGTPYQLLRGALAGTAHSGIVIDAANSVFILDELHAYDPARLGKILAMVGLWARLGGRIGVVSATLPDRLAELLEQSIGQRPHRVEPDPGERWPVRHRLELRSEHLTAPESVDEIAAHVSAGRSVLVVANNVRHARELFDELAPIARAVHGDGSALLLHSRFRAMDRDAIEGRILDRFQAGRSPRAGGLLVATQTVEVSLNVDFDVLHTSGAVLESLIQRFGRVNRLGVLDPAPVVVHEPDYGPRTRGSGEFADGVYAAEPTRLCWQILERHDGGQLDERLFGDWLNEVYASEWGDSWRAEVEDERTRFDEHFLSFAAPFDDRSHLADDFDRLFDGREAVLEEDRHKYKEALNTFDSKAGQLVASRYLIPLPEYATGLAGWDKRLGVAVIDADYTEGEGLAKIHTRGGRRYVAGEVL